MSYEKVTDADNSITCDDCWEVFEATWYTDGTRAICEDCHDSLPENKVCSTCKKTGKDASGNYPSNYTSIHTQHPTCVDWDDVRKYGR
jgi:hypothetical protein